MSAHAQLIDAPSTSSDATRGIWVHPRLFFLALLALLLSLSELLLTDPDTHWHIAVGRWIWDSRSVPWTDLFSHTFAGAPWIAKEWLSQLVFFGAYAVGGWRGVAILSATVIAGSFAYLLWWLQARLQATAALALAIGAASLSMSSWHARPHILVFPVLLLWIGGLVGALERRSPPSWWLTVLMIVWANLHGSFTIGFVLAGILATEAVMVEEKKRRVRLAMRWGLFGASLLFAACLTPYGYRSMWVTATLFGSGEALPYILEWQPLTLDFPGLAAGATLLLVLLCLGLRPIENVFRILLVVLLGALMIKHVRFVSVFALAAAMLVAGPLAHSFPRIGPSRSIAAAFHRVSAAVLLSAVLVIALVRTPAPSPLSTPAAALRAARALHLAGPVYNDYGFGGFLIAEGVKTFIDGRTDQLFLGGFITQLHRAIHADDGAEFNALLARHGATWALVKPSSGEARHLDASSGWHKAFEDTDAALYAKRS